jgi:hypothetical protein
MWTLNFRKVNLLSSIQIDPDDVVFYAVMKRGPTVHCQGHTSVRCTHIAEHRQGFLELHMTLLDATYVEHLNQEFSSIGVMGMWKLLKPKLNEPSFKLERIYDSAEEFLEEAKSSSNPDWAKKCYENL